MEFCFNVQHDCPLAGCLATGKRARRQERIVYNDLLEDAIEHKDIDKWVVNTHSLHNGHLLRLRVGPELISPTHTIPPDVRQQRHHETASVLRPGQEKKRKNVSDQRAAKKASTGVDLKPGVTKKEGKPNISEERISMIMEGSPVQQIGLV